MMRRCWLSRQSEAGNVSGNSVDAALKSGQQPLAFSGAIAEEILALA
jgi:hypothetical protein